MTDAWNGIPPTGADVTGWHWLACGHVQGQALWNAETRDWLMLSGYTRTLERVADAYRYIAPCPAPEGYEP